MKLAKTEKKIMDALTIGGFYGQGSRVSGAVRKLIAKGLIAQENVKITSSYSAPQRHGARGATLIEVSVYSS